MEKKTIKANKMTFASESQRITYLLEQNQYRAKTNFQLIKEGLVREANIKLIAKKKQQHISDEDTVKIVTREAIGKSLGMSGSSFDRGKKVVEKIEELEDEGKDKEADKLKEKMNASISGAARDVQPRKPPPKHRDDPDFWYLLELTALIDTMRFKAKKLQGKRKSTTPSALSWFFKTIDNDAELYSSWLKEKMHDCPVCKGTMFVNESPCGNCISGKVGVYRIPEEEIPE